MTHPFIVLAQAGGSTEIEYGPAVIVVVGFLFVISVLGLLSAMTAAMGAWFTRQAARDSAKAAAAAQAAVQAATASSSSSAPRPEPVAAPEEDESDLLAVLAAAVHVAVGDRAHRVVSIRSSGPGWAQEGRRQIFSSHRVR